MSVKVVFDNQKVKSIFIVVDAAPNNSKYEQFGTDKFS